MDEIKGVGGGFAARAQVAGTEPNNGDSIYYAGQTPLTAADVARIVGNALASLRIHVVESEITDAQDSLRAIVRQATF